MARAPRKGKAQPPLVASHFQEALVLNQYLISLFGIDPLVTHKDGLPAFARWRSSPKACAALRRASTRMAGIISSPPCSRTYRPMPH